MNENLSQIDPSTHAIALGIVLIVAFLMSVIFAGCFLCIKVQRQQEREEPEPGPAEVDETYYPDEGEEALFR